MNKLMKRILIILTVVVGLSMLPIATQTVYAGLDGNGVGSSRTTGSNMSGGPSYHKTGFLITVSVSDSENSPSHHKIFQHKIILLQDYLT